MKTWEYKTIELVPSELLDLETICNEFGEDGWELVQIGMPFRDAFLMFKRRVHEDPTP